MLRQLSSDGEVCGCGFRVLDRVAQPTVSHHLRVLREAGLVHFERERSYLRYRLDPDALSRVAAIVEGLRLAPPASSGDDVDGDELAACCGAGRS
jgi:ArsR family transcriptional regulator